MFLQEITINEFRNLINIKFKAEKGLNIIIGENGQGKTSLLEAIHFLATGISFRTSDQQVLLSYDHDKFRIEGLYQIGDRVMRSLIIYDRNKGKKFFLNEKKKSLLEQEIKIVLFTPDDLYIIKGPPKKRRLMIDNGLKNISKEYYQYLDTYTKLLKKRNFLLQTEQVNSKIFTALNQAFVEQSAKVLLARLNYINFLDEVLPKIYEKINPGKGTIKIKYALSFPLDNDKINIDILNRKMEEQLILMTEVEKKRKKTLTGPHIDDLHIYADGKMARQYCSQGQQRSIILALKLAEMESAAKIKGQYPLFFLDEVLAELDEGKRENLLDYLEKAPFQSFLTTVNTEYIKNVKKAQVNFINQGALFRKE